MPNLSDTFVVRQPGLRDLTGPVTEDLYQRIDAQFDGFNGHELIVVLLSGSARLVLDQDDMYQDHQLNAAGDFVIVPANTWHTAKVGEPTQMVFITPGEGTISEERP